MANKKRIATSVAAVATAAALLLGGTFAWQSVNQTALNEASDVINPGGRLHDDFNGSNKDVYVENFAEEPIYARIQLSEYFEIIANHGVEGVESSTTILGNKTTNEGTGEVEYTYKTFTNYESLDGTTLAAGVDGTYDSNAEEGETGYAWWSWETGGSTVYMPTFNMNKDSLQADINGTYVDAVGGISDRDGDQYENYVEYEDGDSVFDTEIYDADANNVEDGGIKEILDVEHTARYTGDATLISMDEWENDYNSEPGPYWVYDTDGWVYWAQAIQPGTATGLLLDGIELNQVMDDSWYYAINVVAQFVTGDDTGVNDGTGFHDTNDPTLPAISAEAENLLNTIIEANEAADDGDNGDDGDDEGDEYVPFNIVNTVDKWANIIYMSANDFASDGTGDGLQLMTCEGETDINGTIANVTWTIQTLDENMYSASENEGDEYETSVFTVKSTKNIDDIADGDTFMFRVTATDSQYPENPFSTDYTVIIGEDPENVTANVLSITAAEGFAANEYEYDDVDINYSIKRAVGDENAYSLTDYTEDAEYTVYAGTGSFDEDSGNTILDWDTETSGDITVGENGTLTLVDLNSGYYKIVATYSDGSTAEARISFWKPSIEVSGIGEETLDENVTEASFSIALSDADIALLGEDDSFTVSVCLWNEDTAATGVTVSSPTVESNTYTWKLTFGDTAERNVEYELEITPPAALADYYDTCSVSFVVGSEDY